MACLGEGLNDTSGHAVAVRNCGKWDFVAEVAQLEGCVGAAVDAGELLVGWVGVFKCAAGLDPVEYIMISD